MSSLPHLKRSCELARPQASSRLGHSFEAVRRRTLGPIALVVLFLSIYYACYWLRFEGELGPIQWHCFASTAAWVVAVKAAIFLRFRIAHGWNRTVGFYDFVVLCEAATCAVLVVAAVDRGFGANALIPRGIFLLDWGATIIAIGGARAVLRGVREGNWWGFLPADQIPALIVGANETGQLLLRAIIANGKRRYRVLGFIDDDERRVGTRVAGVPVLGTLDQIWRLAQRSGAQQILVANEGISGQHVRKLVEEARRRDVEVRVLPSYEQMIGGQVAIQPRPVVIDDLLRREPVAIDLESIRRWIDGRVLLVTGSAGSIGSEICRQLSHFSPRRIVLVDRSETGQFFLERELQAVASEAEIEVCVADVLDPRRMEGIFRQHRPDVVFHAAAYKHVPLMESHPGEAVKNIVMATRQVAELAAQCGSESFVLISTDKAVNPTSVMGACKRVAELYVQSLADSACRYVTVRFGNVLDSAGSVVQIFRQQIACGGPVTVTDPQMRRYFMTIPEAARLVIQAGAIGQGGNILVLDMGDPVRIADLAEDMIRLSGLRVGEDIAVEYTGLRPGEKLFEELRVPEETQLPTCHPKIIVADRRPADRARILAAIEELARLADEAPAQILGRLERLVPEYHPLDCQAGARRAA